MGTYVVEPHLYEEGGKIIKTQVPAENILRIFLPPKSK